MTQTEIQSAYIALLLGCRFVMDVCIAQVTTSTAVIVSDIAVYTLHKYQMRPHILHTGIGSMSLHTMQYLQRFGWGEEDLVQLLAQKTVPR